MSILGNTTAGDPSVDSSDVQQQITPTPTNAAPNGATGASDGSNDLQEAQQSQPTSRLQAIIQAVAKVGSTALSGIPDRGRPSFVTGLGEGARAEQNAVAQQQAIKFRNFDDQVRLAQLHNQDLKMQQDTQAQKDAHVKAELDNRSLANSLGIKYDTIASDGKTVMDHLTAQTAANGSASVPAGTHLSGDGENVNIPSNDKQTQDGQKQMYSMLGPALGLPPLPPGAEFVPPKQLNMLTNKIHGFNIDGSAPKHEELPGILGAAQAQRDNLAKNGATPPQLQALDNMIGIYKANLDALDKHEADVKAQNKQSELDVENSPANVAAAGKKAASIEQQKLNVTNSPANQAAAARGAGLKSSAEQSAKNMGILDSVAFDPNFQNADGTKGANVVISKEDAATKGLTFYKADPNKINTVVAGMNDVQNKLNQLASVANNRQTMAQVDPGLAAAMLAHGKGITLEFGGHGGGASGGIGVDTSRANEVLYGHDVKQANQATRDFVAAFIGAHEAITQLPRLQTFGQSSRMTEKQMEAAINLLPQPGDREFAAQKMTSLQGMIDPLRKQIPHMPGAESIPSWLEQRKQRVSQSGGTKLGQIVTSNPVDFINRLQPK
jgi:hypothetical protein